LIASVLSGTLGGNVITQVAVQWYGARQRQRERMLSKADAHEVQLRDAYAELITAELRFEAITDEYIDMLRSTRNQRQELLSLAEVLEYSKGLGVKLENATDTVRARSVVLHLLERDRERRAILDLLIKGLRGETSREGPDDVNGLIADRDAHVGAVKALMVLVAGAFAPDAPPPNRKRLKG
jgi:hypothetical protein